MVEILIAFEDESVPTKHTIFVPTSHAEIVVKRLRKRGIKVLVAYPSEWLER